VFGKSDKNSKEKEHSAMQEYLHIAEIKDSTVVLKDGSLRAVMAVSSINFDLKSTEEQEAIIFAFQRFLNSIDFPVQIVISSRKYDISGYLKMLEKKSYTEKNSLLKNQIIDYTEFVEGLVDEAGVTSKYFYITVPFYVVSIEKGGFLKKISSAINPRKAVFHKRELFETSKNQLFQRVGEIRELLGGMGLKVAMLSTQELIELYYNYYNPSEFDHVSLSPTEEIRMERG
jgi:type IV secretory pathway VirB4 component